MLLGINGLSRPLLGLSSGTAADESLTDSVAKFLNQLGLNLSAENISRDDVFAMLRTTDWQRELSVRDPEDFLRKIFLALVLDQRALVGEISQTRFMEKICAGCAHWVWPAGDAIPLQDSKVLRRVYGVSGFFYGFDSWVRHLWTLLLSSFIANDLYYYVTYPAQRYDMTLGTIFFSTAAHEKSLTASLVKPFGWSALLAAPLLWGIFKGLRSRGSEQILTADTITDLLAPLENYQPGLWCDIGAWLLPVYSLRNTLDLIARALLWDGRLSSADRYRLLTTLNNFTARAEKISKLYALAVNSEIAHGLAPLDIMRLKKIGLSDELLIAYLQTKKQTLGPIKIAAQSQTIKSWPRCFYANYLQWRYSQPYAQNLRPLFWLIKTLKIYFKTKFIYTLYQGLAELIHLYLAERECKNQGKLWLYMDRIADYVCSVCGDLPIFYANIFTVDHCLQDYLRLPRNATQILSVLERLDLSNLSSIDLSHQNLMDNAGGLVRILTVLQQRTVGLTALYLNNTTPMIGPDGLHALGRFISQTPLQILSLRGQQIGVAGTALLAPVLADSKLLVLDLAYNLIGGPGAQILATVLPRSNLEQLDLFACLIEDFGATALGKILNTTLIKRLYLAVNNIGDMGLAALAPGLARSRIIDLDLWGNTIGSLGTAALAEQLIDSPLQRLVLRNNPDIGYHGTVALAAALPKSQLQELVYSYVGLGDLGAIALGESLSFSKILILVLRSNRISAVGIRALTSLKNSLIKILDLSYNNFDLTCVMAITEIMSAPGLQELILEGNNLDHRTMEILAPALDQSSIYRLLLADNNIGDRGTEIIARHLIFGRLNTLDIGENNIGNRGASAIAQVLQNCTLRNLFIHFNKITGEGARALAKFLHQARLLYLVLDSNPIGPIGALTIADNLAHSDLKSLSLSGCNINDQGVIALANQLANSALEFLALSYNNITSLGAEALAAVLSTKLPALRRLWIDTIDNDVKRMIAQGKPNTLIQHLLLEGNNIGTMGAKALCRVLPPAEIPIDQFSLVDNPIEASLVDINTCAISTGTRLRPFFLFNLAQQASELAVADFLPYIYAVIIFCVGYFLLRPLFRKVTVESINWGTNKLGFFYQPKLKYVNSKNDEIKTPAPLHFSLN